MASEEVIDLALDPLDERRRRRRLWLRVGLPVLGAILVLGALVGIALYSYRENRDGALRLAEDMLSILERRVAQEVAVYLAGPELVLRIATDTLAGAQDITQANRLQHERGAIALLNTVPHLLLFSAGDAEGNYLQLRRNDVGGLDTKIVANAPPPRRVTWIRRNAAGETVREEEDPSDDFDPRTRPWYMGARPGAGPFWTDAYIFFTDRTPGITLSIALPGPRGIVLGLDITLGALSEFLGGLEIGQHGRAMIVDRTGHLIAFHDPARVLRDGPQGSVAVRLDQLADPVLARAYDLMRLRGTVRTVEEIGGIRQVIAVRPLQGTRGWSVVMTVPESDFTGFAAVNGEHVLAMSLGVAALAGLLAIFLVHQGLRGDRVARQVLDRGRAIAAQSRAYANLAASAGLFDAGKPPPPALTEELAAVTGAHRASLWRLSDDGRTLRCEDSFERGRDVHTAGAVLHHDELPGFFVALSAGTPIEVADAAADRRTAELHRIWLNPLGSTALSAAPMLVEGKVAGMVWVEDAAPGIPGVADFLRAVANMAALRLHAIAPAALPAPAAPSRAATPPRDTALALAPEDAAELVADVYPDVAVMVLRFIEAGGGKDAMAPLDRIAGLMQGIATRHALRYVKLLGDTMVAACGFTPAESGAGAAQRMAAAALELRDACAALLDAKDAQGEFRIGLDLGVAIGSPVGQGPRFFNLWGDAVRTADRMAVSAAPGAIQATEAAYAALSAQFLFRPRGAFWLPRLGAMKSFVLAGRL